jgi:large subunit ribosomal protein L29
MKRTDTKKALAGKNATELQTELEALLKEQFGLRMQVATQQLTNTSKLKDVRRGIARVRTLLGQAARTSAAPAESKSTRASAAAAAKPRTSAKRPAAKSKRGSSTRTAAKSARA